MDGLQAPFSGIPVHVPTDRVLVPTPVGSALMRALISKYQASCWNRGTPTASRRNG
jgi:hypothetical protein